MKTEINIKIGQKVKNHYEGNLARVRDLIGAKSNGTVTGIINGERALKPNEIVTISKDMGITTDELITGNKPETVNEILGEYTHQKPLSEMDKRVLAMFHNLDPRDYNAAIEFLNTMAQTSPYPQRGNVEEKAEDWNKINLTP